MILYKLNEKEKEILKEVKEKTMTYYTIEKDNDLIEIEGLITAIEDLLCEIHNLEEEKEDLKREIRLGNEEQW